MSQRRIKIFNSIIELNVGYLIPNSLFPLSATIDIISLFYQYYYDYVLRLLGMYNWNMGSSVMDWNDILGCFHTDCYKSVLLSMALGY